MGQTTKIEWTATYLDEPIMWEGEMTDVIPGATFNLVIGCEKVSPACKYCYAETLDKRWNKGVHWGPNSDRKQMSEQYWKQPEKWNRQAQKAGINRKVFCSSLADWAEDHPQLVGPRERLFNLIELTPNLTWLLLTKRPENILKFIPESWKQRPLHNVWFGTTVENADYMWRIEELCKVPARIRFLSCEPLLGDLPYIPQLSASYDGSTILFSDRYGHAGKIHWVIAGGESGDHARPSHPQWFITLRNQCNFHGTPFFFKQWGEWQAGSNIVDGKHVGKHGVMLSNGNFFEWDFKSDKPFEKSAEAAKRFTSDEWNALKANVISKVGKSVSGRILEDCIYNSMPLIQHER